MSTFLRVLENEARNARPSAARRAEFAESCLEVRMFNVGEGEAILLVFPQKRAWFIDGGSSNGSTLNRKLGEGLIAYLEERQLTLEAFVPTHPHIDHVGALATILSSGSGRIGSSLAIYRSDDGTWNLSKTWLNELRGAIASFATSGSGNVELRPLSDAHREIIVSEGVRAHLSAGSGDGAYTAIFLQLRFHKTPGSSSPGTPTAPTRGSSSIASGPRTSERTS